MSESVVKTLVAIVVTLFLAAVFTVVKPKSEGGKLARRLCVANVIGWFILLPLSTAGDPPPFLILGSLLWLANLILMPAAAMALRVSHKEHDERTSYLAVASAYVLTNVMILFVIPLIWVVIEVKR